MDFNSFEIKTSHIREILPNIELFYYEVFNDVEQSWNITKQKYGNYLWPLSDIEHHVLYLILFALDIVKEIKTIKTPDDIPLSIRIGINMGNVSVGILGNEIPRLCVVGNTVNMASRLQSTADIDTIQLSRHVYEQLEDIDFDKKLEIITKKMCF